MGRSAIAVVWYWLFYKKTNIVKKLLIYTGILFTFGYIASKAKKLYDEFSLSFDIKNLRLLEVNAAGLVLSFLADIYVKINNDIPIYAPVKINFIEFYIYGKKIGVAKIYKDGIFIAPNKPVLLKDVQIDIFFKDYSYLYNGFMNMQQTNLEYKVNYSIAGKVFEYTGVYQP